MPEITGDAMEKSEARLLMKNRIAALLPAEKAVEEKALLARILEEPLWQKAKIIFCYLSTEKEINTYSLIEAAFSQGKIVAAPYVLGNGIMEARQLVDISTLRPDGYGILAPSSGNQRIKPDEINLAIVPGLAYDQVSLLRLGRGGGYYDRYLAGCKAYRLAPAWDCQMVEGILPRDPHDLEMDMVVTAKRVYLHPKVRTQRKIAEK
jgi:5-formyltetrahydrofolate cyclo-ligase